MREVWGEGMYAEPFIHLQNKFIMSVQTLEKCCGVDDFAAKNNNLLPKKPADNFEFIISCSRVEIMFQGL